MGSLKLPIDKIYFFYYLIGLDIERKEVIISRWENFLAATTGTCLDQGNLSRCAYWDANTNPLFTNSTLNANPRCSYFSIDHVEMSLYCYASFSLLVVFIAFIRNHYLPEGTNFVIKRLKNEFFLSFILFLLS